MTRARGLFVAALAAGASFTLAAWAGWQGGAIVAWKGGGVALLTLWAAANAQRRREIGWIAVVLALGAAGDVLLETAGMVPGAVAFLAGHVVAIAFYRRHGARRIGIVAPLAVAGAAWLLARDPVVPVYALVLGLMADQATRSVFPLTVKTGAWLFVASDLLIFARLGPLATNGRSTLLVWPLYFAGQALIVHGVVTTLARDDDLHHRI